MKRQLRIGGLVAAASMAAIGVAAAAGGLTRAAPPEGVVPDTTRNASPQGRWKEFRNPASEATLERLDALGYLPGSRTAPELSGVTRHDAARAQPGLNFLTSGHAPVALLMDMEGRVLHHWHAEVGSIWPDLPLPPGDILQKHFFRRARPLPDGSLLAIFEGIGLVKMDRDSRVLWAAARGAHHALEVLPSGDIAGLTREVRILPRFSRVMPVAEDFLTFLSPEGEERRRISLIEAFERSPMSVILEAADRKTGDFLHTNALQILDGRLAGRVTAFAAGNVLLSFREVSTLGVLDPEKGAMVWAHQGDYLRQHDPRMLDGGRILLFDNGRERSRILELDPASGETITVHAGTPEEPFFTETCGTAQRLENGNTLITESENGRAFEIAPDGETVWEWISPYRAGRDRELIATLFELGRLPAAYGEEWLAMESAASRGSAFPLLCPRRLR